MINTGTTSLLYIYIYKMTMVWYLLCDHVRNDRFVCCCFFCLVTEMAEEVLYPLRARLTSLCSGWNGELPSCQLMIILLPVLFIFWSLSVTVNSWWHSLNNQSMVQTAAYCSVYLCYNAPWSAHLQPCSPHCCYYDIENLQHINKREVFSPLFDFWKQTTPSAVWHIRGTDLKTFTSFFFLLHIKGLLSFHLS